ncbi:hypothetical protein M153_40680001557, partial [Pseudoloma neurophilia]
ISIFKNMSNHSIKLRLRQSITAFLSHLQLLLAPINTVDQLSEILTDLHVKFERFGHWIDVYNAQKKMQPVKFVKQKTFVAKNTSHFENFTKNCIEEFDGTLDDNGDLILYDFTSENCHFIMTVHKKYGILQIETGSLELNVKVMEYYLTEILLTHEKSLSKTKSNSSKISDFLNIESLNELELGHIIEKIETFLSFYTDYTTRLCDFCLGKEFASERTIERDYFGAYHKECMGKDLE